MEATAFEAPELNGAGRGFRSASAAPIDCPYESAPSGPPGRMSGPVDVTRGSVPVLLVASIVGAAVAGAFHLGSLYTEINRERSEVIRRLDNIEQALGRILPAYSVDHKKR